MEQENYEKIITINELSYESILHYIHKLLFFMYKENSNPNIEYFRLRLKDSEKCPFAKDLKLEWTCSKQPERSKREDQFTSLKERFEKDHPGFKDDLQCKINELREVCKKLDAVL